MSDCDSARKWSSLRIEYIKNILSHYIFNNLCVSTKTFTDSKLWITLGSYGLFKFGVFAPPYYGHIIINFSPNIENSRSNLGSKFLLLDLEPWPRPLFNGPRISTESCSQCRKLKTIFLNLCGIVVPGPTSRIKVTTQQNVLICEQ